MKKIVLSLLAVFMLSSVALSQKYAFVDMNYILSEIPTYKEAQKQLDDLSEKWQKEIEAKYKEIEAKYKTYQQEQILLPEDTKRQREQEIFESEKAAKELQKKRFGVDGSMFQKRKELIEPIQDEIYKAIKTMAKEKGYDFVMEKEKNSNILYADPKYDKSDIVLKKIKK
jgi:outer membrane protein